MVDYNFGQDDITTISTVGTACGMFSMPAGVMFDFVGPQCVLFLATLVMATGYVLWALAFSGVVTGTLALFCFANAFVLLGSGWMDVGSLMTCILNFPQLRGSVVALQKTFMGLGSTIIATCFVAFFQSSLRNFSLFILTVVLVFGFLGAFIIALPRYYITTVAKKKMTPEAQDAARASLDSFRRVPVSSRRLRVAFVLLALNMAFLTSYSIVAAYANLSAHATTACACVAITLLFSFFSLPLVPSEHREVRDESATAMAVLATVAHSESERAPVTPRAADGLPLLNREEESASGDSVAPMVPQFESGFIQNLRRPLLWCLFWTSFCNIGTGVVIVVNSAQIYRAVNDNVFVTSTNALIVALMGVASALARIILGVLDMWLEKRRQSVDASANMLSIPLLTVTYPISSAMAVLGASLLLVVPAAVLLLPMVLLSMAYGFIWASTALCIRLMFAHDVGKHYNFCFLGAVASTICINRFMFGELYNQEARAQGTYPFCSGVECIRTSVLVLIGLNSSSLLTALYVHLTFKRHCASEIEKRAVAQVAKVTS